MSNGLPLAVYIHVPKTGGTSVNETVKDLDPFGIEHIERFIGVDLNYIDEWNSQILAKRLNWISGHVSFDEVAQCLIWQNKHVEYFGTVREPISQLISHVNFIITQASVDFIPQYNTAEYFRNVDIRSTNFQDPYDVIHMLTRYSDFLLNNQARTILGKDFFKLSEIDIARRIERYSMISTEYNVSDVISCMGYDFRKAKKTFPELNKATYAFDKSIFYEYPLASFLKTYHRYDMIMYNIIQSIDFPSDSGRRQRPMYTSEGEFTLENFSEQEYLFSCPDVEWAINQGAMSSALDHFKNFGRHEGRRRIVEI